MGHETKLWGYIDADEEFAEHNAARIATLPAERDIHTPIPLLTREMFSSSRLDYLGHLTVFGRTYNGVETKWAAWREQFEALLRTMYWCEVKVWLETDLWGTYQCSWEAQLSSKDKISDWSAASPTTEWDYHGPQGNFWRDLR